MGKRIWIDVDDAVTYTEATEILGKIDIDDEFILGLGVELR